MAAKHSNTEDMSDEALEVALQELCTKLQSLNRREEAFANPKSSSDLVGMEGVQRQLRVEKRQ